MFKGKLKTREPSAVNPEGGDIKPAWDGRGGAGEGSIVFYKEQETSLKEYMKGTLKQMQISKGGWGGWGVGRGGSPLISQLLCPGAACRNLEQMGLLVGRDEVVGPDVLSPKGRASWRPRGTRGAWIQPVKEGMQLTGPGQCSIWDRARR